MTTLAQHLERRPEMPRPFVSNSPTAIVWQQDFQEWVDKKALLTREVECTLTIPPVDHHKPACTPRADYQWRDIPARRTNTVSGPKTCHDCSNSIEGRGSRCKRCADRHSHRNRSPRPAWGGADKDYNRIKAAEARERRRQAIRETLDERNGPPAPHLRKIA